MYDRQGDWNRALEYYQQFFSSSKDSGNKDCVALGYLNLGLIYQYLDFSKAEDCLKSGVDVYDSIRNLLHSRDDWKISIRNRYRNAYNALWVIQSRRNKIVEALSSAERERAQALLDLLKYDMELARSSWSAENTEAMFDILRFLPSQTVFLAKQFLGARERNEIHFTKTKLDGNIFQEGIIFVQSWIEKVCQKL